MSTLKRELNWNYFSWQPVSGGRFTSATSVPEHFVIEENGGGEGESRRFTPLSQESLDRCRADIEATIPSEADLALLESSFVDDWASEPSWNDAE